MTLPRTIAAAATLLAVGAPMFTPEPSAAANAADRPSTVSWNACPEYTDEMLAWLGVPAEAVPSFHELMARTECGTISVPLDYDDPGGERITVALTRLKATDQANRLGSLAVNPGGPGGSGYLMPLDLSMAPPGVTPVGLELNERYDLIGFDPRGVGYSTSYDCADLGPGGRHPAGVVTEADAREMYAAVVAANRECSQSNADFLAQLTTVNVAHDLDRIRAALGEDRMNFLGVSWGTWLGAVYRSEHPRHAGRVWIDSVAPPEFRFDEFATVRSNAVGRDFTRMAGWLAEHDEYGFGTTTRAVEKSLARLAAAFDAEPRVFTDLDFVFDGAFVAMAGDQDAPTWALAARLLADLRDATGPEAPQSVKDLFDEPDRGDPPPGTPRLFNETMNQAVFCNEDLGDRDFDSTWADYRKALKKYPVTGRLRGFVPPCAGWTIPPEPVRLRDSGTPLVLSGHRYETLSPYEWTWDMHDEVGGKVMTVNDDVHGSALMSPDCAGRIAEFFETGRVGSRTCVGAPSEPEETGTFAFAEGSGFRF
ncbi:alpha/beta fold hydrolase [Phytomonospora endophytica]|uniref:Pimeloyl-ACP methyl ester carboxylesterase n=1 Tax=Phytomonospora endophytica TaxID=714109 RepID=A0A841FET0_9ACTN|nr:alpha/beta fold hydrolase [Phytomonospora endophytica]MBB6034776.1 pimeloyl-ACP methyl ester carboxylesterase [Phytomonospora endophytica]GIG69021.1 alpha/beta hydrolase [Phytomonospora endophytica]